jgi:hypothetical protein
MTMKTCNFAFGMMLIFGILLTACNKENPSPDALEDLVTSEDLTTAYNLIQDTEDQVDELIETRGADNCPIVIVVPDDGSFPRTVTIDYGIEGCEGPNGRIRKGQLVIEQSDALINENAIRRVKPVNFSIDDVQIAGLKTLTNQGTDNNNNVTFNRLANVTLTFPNGKSSTWDGDHTLTQTAGGTTISLLDNEYQITGNSSGINRNGTPYAVDIIEPLVKEKLCPWVISGVTEITVNENLRSIDYGDGVCDRKATVTLQNGITRDILIWRWW